MGLFWFLEFRFSDIFFARKSISEIHVKNWGAGGTYYLHFFYQDYLFCINRTKEIELITEITRCVSEQER